MATHHHASAETSKQKRLDFYSPETGIYESIYGSRTIPSDPFLDIVSFIFSHKHNGVTAFIDSTSGSSISYTQLHSLVKTMASGLYHHMGIRQGDVVLLLLPNSVHFPVIFLGLLYLGAVVTAMNPSSSINEIKKQIAECDARFAFTALENAEKLRRTGVPVIAAPSNLGLDSNQSAYSEFFELLNHDFGSAPKPLVRQTDVAAIMYSSGTTGASKGAMITHGNFIAVVELFVRFEASQYEYPSSSNVYLDAIPMFHIYGLSLFVLGLVSLGSSIVVMRKFDASEVVRVIDRFRVTHFPVVPPILVALTKSAKDVCGNGFKSLKQVSSGAAPLRRKIIEDFAQAFPHVDFIQGYGMTESTAVGTRGFNTKAFRKYSSVGLLAPSTQAKVVDWVSGAFLPPGSTGELWIRGPGNMKGYLSNAEATKLAIDEDGWLHTGDIVYFDEDGHLYILDRLKEVIKYKGFQVAPADLENTLVSHPEILDAAVTAAPDEICGEIPVACVVRTPGSTITPEAVMDYVAMQVAPHKKVRKVVFVNSIPKSPTGKILRREIKNVAQSRL